MSEIGIYGGSFDPPHVGHVLLVSYALSVSALERVIVAPVFSHPFGKDMCAFEHRLEMCERAFSCFTRVEVSDIERTLKRPSYTLNLVEALKARHPEATLRLLMGADLLAQTDRWHRFDRIRELAPPLVAGRAGYARPDVDRDAPLLPEVSSTEVREALERGDDVSARVPRGVLDYIRAHGLYRPDPGPGS